jgi:hypothetical protein
MREALVTLLVEVAHPTGGPGQAKRLADLFRHHARTWKDRDTAAPDTAARLLELLMTRGF